MFKYFIKQLNDSQKGATAIEYALIASLIAVVIIVSLKFFGGELTNMYSMISSAVGDATD